MLGDTAPAYKTLSSGRERQSGGFNRRIDAFLSEAALHKPGALEKLNCRLDLWIEKHHHKSIHHKGLKPFRVKVIAISEHCGIYQDLPEELAPLTTDYSQILDGLNKQNITNRAKTAVATTFRRQTKEDTEHT